MEQLRKAGEEVEEEVQVSASLRVAGDLVNLADLLPLNAVDLLLIVGCALLSSGVAVCLGYGAGLITAGALLMAIGSAAVIGKSRKIRRQQRTTK